jgi:hypothetical protein
MIGGRYYWAPISKGDTVPTKVSADTVLKFVTSLASSARSFLETTPEDPYEDLPVKMKIISDGIKKFSALVNGAAEKGSGYLVFWADDDWQTTVSHWESLIIYADMVAKGKDAYETYAIIKLDNMDPMFKEELDAIIARGEEITK